jgi:uncharacterized protein with von Willebrand factor type A (vWA) domain
VTAGAGGSNDGAALATGFARALRAVGLDAPPSATIDFARALGLLGIARPEHVFWAGHACFCAGPDDADLYRSTVLAYFGHAGVTFPGGRLTTVPPAPAHPPAVANGAEQPPVDPGPETRGPASPVRAAYGAAEILRTKDFGTCTEAELAEVTGFMVRVRRNPPLRRSRRLVAARRPGHGSLDVRRTLRSSLASRGDPFRLRRRVRGTRPRRLVLLLDVSGSMGTYAPALLRFAHAMVLTHRAAEVFTMGTRCTRVTRELAWRDTDAALRRVARVAPDLDGGTRLGEGLSEFNRAWGLSGLARGAIIVVCSDGWDRGAPSVLADEMGRLARVAHRIIWANPLKGSEGYEPLTRGMQAALPHVDEFVSGHSLEALEELVEVISR